MYVCWFVGLFVLVFLLTLDLWGLGFGLWAFDDVDDVNGDGYDDGY